MKNKRLIIILSAVIILLLIPFVAMQFTNGVNWSSSDFVIMGILLTGTGLLLEFSLRKIKTVKYRLMVSGIIIFLFLLVWVELAVGVFGTPFAGS
ncbi:MAG: hypothetical protein COA32_05970 [Fluviicola sp.]|nr:MAG: hypothetical protein COA32_05970 [Fluviicola sp.]